MMMIITNAAKFTAIAKNAIIKLKVKKTTSKKAFVSDDGKNSITATLQIVPITSKPVKVQASAIISRVIYAAPILNQNMSVTFFFTNADLIDNKLTKYHGFNDTVDVSIFDETNQEIEVSVDVTDQNRVVVDLGRLVVNNTWKIKIEK